MSGIILIASILIWALGYFPRNVEPLKNNINKNYTQNSEQLENSYIGKIGKFVEPVMSPLGFDWRMSVSLLAGISGKEIVVSTLGVLFQTKNESDLANNNLINKLKEAKQNTNSRVALFNPITAFSYLIFILVYFPCIAVIAAIKKETGSWKWSVFTIFYSTSLAWILAFLIQFFGKIYYL